ncbi:hypothetical protein ACJJTC_002648 [Scirpophaga incertulas]
MENRKRCKWITCQIDNEKGMRAYPTCLMYSPRDISFSADQPISQGRLERMSAGARFPATSATILDDLGCGHGVMSSCHCHARCSNEWRLIGYIFDPLLLWIASCEGNSSWAIFKDYMTKSALDMSTQPRGLGRPRLTWISVVNRDLKNGELTPQTTKSDRPGED